MKILAVGLDRTVSIAALDELSKNEMIDTNQIGSYDVLYVDLIHIGMDEEFERVVDKIEDGTLQVRKIVMLASAGMNHEVKPCWIEVQDLKELILEIQYVAKLVDETELPYTILRPVEIKNEVQSKGIELHAEGQEIKNRIVNSDDIKAIIQEAILTDEYINQSIGISSKE